MNALRIFFLEGLSALMKQPRLLAFLLLLFVPACKKPAVTFTYDYVQPIGFDVQPTNENERVQLFDRIRAWLLKHDFTEVTTDAERQRVTVSTSAPAYEFVYSRVLAPSQPKSFASIACKRMFGDNREEYRIILRGFRHGGPLDHKRQEPLVEKYFADFRLAFPDLKPNR